MKSTTQTAILLPDAAVGNLTQIVALYFGGPVFHDIFASEHENGVWLEDPKLLNDFVRAPFPSGRAAPVVSTLAVAGGVRLQAIAQRYGIPASTLGP